MPWVLGALRDRQGKRVVADCRHIYRQNRTVLVVHRRAIWLIAAAGCMKEQSSSRQPSLSHQRQALGNQWRVAEEPGRGWNESVRCIHTVLG